jgi:phage replication O-like protein O
VGKLKGLLATGSAGDPTPGERDPGAEEPVMASPQLKNGYTPIANQLLEALYRTDLTGGEWALIMCIARASYGWSQKEAPISIREAARRLGKHYTHTKRTTRALMARGILARHGASILIAKDYETWGPRTVPGTVDGPGDHGSDQGGTTDRPIGGTNLVPTLPLNLTSLQGRQPRKTISKTITKTNIADTPRVSAGKAGKITKPREKKPRTTHPDTDRLLTEFGVLYRQKFETDYLASFARDKKLLHDMLTASGVEEVRSRMTAFLKYGTKRTRDRADYSIPAFRAAWNELGVLKARGDL